MNPLERAYQTLGLSPDASHSEAKDAYEELIRVWDPKRFEDDPELAERAHRKLKSFEEAYRLISRSEKKTPRATPPPHPWLEEKERKWRARRGKKEAEEAPPPEEGGRSHSLFDDAFSERLSEPKRKVPLWLIIVVALVGLAIAGVLLMDGGSEAPLREETKNLTTEGGPESGGPSAAERTEGALDSDPEVATAPPAQPIPGAGLEETAPKQPATQPPSSLARAVESRESQSGGTSTEASGERRQSPPEPPAAPPDTNAAPAPRSEEPARTPRLTRNPVPPEETPAPEEEAVPNEDEGLTGPEAEEAFAVLRQESQSARELLADQIPSVRYIDWKALPKDGREFWIDLTAEIVASGEELHFIWAVDPEQRRVRPMSQAARDLELGRSRM